MSMTFGGADVAIVNYGLGNLTSVGNAFRYLGANIEITSDTNRILAARRLILPGVGAFGKGIENLKNFGIDKAVIDFAKSGKSLLGICLGFQLLCLSSEEFGRFEGLGLLDADIRKIPGNVRLPHVGWQKMFTISTDRQAPLNVSESTAVYFVHSYCALDVRDADEKSWAQYGPTRFIAGCKKSNIWGMQFHPEKSGLQGLEILRQFLRS